MYPTHRVTGAAGRGAAFLRAIVLLCSATLLAPPAQAGEVEINFSGTTSPTSGGLSYPIDGMFSGRIVYETEGVTDASGAPTFGSFTVAPLLVELSTPLGDIAYQAGAGSVPANVMTFTQRENAAGQQTSRISFGANSLAFDGFTGALAGFTPISIDIALQTVSTPAGDMLFSDPNLLLSGADTLVEAMLINSSVQVVYTDGGSTGNTGLVISNAAVTPAQAGDDTVAVPLPATALVLLALLLGRALRTARRDQAHV